MFCRLLCMFVAHTHGHTRRRKLGLHLQLQDERKGERRGKDKSIEESMCGACVRRSPTNPGMSKNATIL